MKSLLTSESKDITKYLQEQIGELYNNLTDNRMNDDFIKGEIFALKVFLKEFGLESVIKAELVEHKEMLD